MIDPHHIEDRFSDLFDGSLEPQENASVQAHLETCAACRKGYEAFGRSTRALRSLRLAPTSPAHVHSVEAAVIASTRRRYSWPVLSHAAAVLVGLGLTYGARGCVQPTATQPTEVVREVYVEVPVEVLVETERLVRVEVPVEVRVEVPVEVRVEVPVKVIEYIERSAPKPSLVDYERTHVMLANIEHALSQIAHATRTTAPNPAPIKIVQPKNIAGAVPPDPAPHASLTTQRISSPLRIRRTGDQVRIHTRGTLDEIVPALIDTLNDPDQIVAQAVEQHLEALRAELAGDPFLKPLSNEEPNVKVDRPGGLRRLLSSNHNRSEPLPTPSTHARWLDWWLDSSTSLAGGEAL